MKKSTNIRKNNIEIVALHNLGCKVNAYETEKMEELLKGAGCRVVPFGSKADLYVINTCSVTQMADKKSRQMIHRARRNNPDAIVVAAGCFVQAGGITPEEIGADILLGNDKKGQLLEVIEAYLEKRESQTAVIDINADGECYEELYISGGARSAAGSMEEVAAKQAADDPEGEPAKALAGNMEEAPGHGCGKIRQEAHGHTRAFVKIQDGCNQFCSYCRIPYVRGRVRSRTAASILDETAELLRKGYREIVLTGIHVSSYRDGETDLIGLVERIDRLPGMQRLRLSSMEPRLITEEAAQRLSTCRSLCPHFHLSLQSGCDATIARMNRHYTTADFEKGVSYLRTYFDHPAITTDVIVGFPGETDEEFAASRAFVERIAFADMHIFKFSAREGTRAYRMEDQVSEEEKNKRSDVLLKLAENMQRNFYETWKGREVEILFEEETDVEGKRLWTGFTREYLRVYKESGENLKNCIRKENL